MRFQSRFKEGMAVLSIGLPLVFCFWFVFTYGVNVPYWDQWELVSLLEKLYGSGSVTPGDLFAQHNEHRLFFPRLLMLGLAGLTSYNVKAEMYVSLLLLTAIVGMVLYSYYDEYPERLRADSWAQSLFLFAPVVWVLVSFRHYANLLWGWQLQIYLAVASVLSMVVLLERVDDIGLPFFGAVIAAVVASFSFFAGLLAWPAGIIYFLFERHRDWKRYVVWLTAAGVTYALFFTGWSSPSSHPGLFVAQEPVTSLHYFVVSLGSAYAFTVPVATGFGVFTLVLGLLVTYQTIAADATRMNAKWLSLSAFGVGVSLTITVARAKLGVTQALASRYAIFASLILIGLYLSVLNLERETALTGLKTGLLFVLILGAMIGYSGGLQKGQDFSEHMTAGQFGVLNYQTSPDGELKQVYPSPESVRQYSKFFETNNLSAFANTNGQLHTPDTVESAYDINPGWKDINGDRRLGYHVHPPTNLTFADVTVPEQQSLCFAVGMNPDAWSERGDGVRYMLFVDGDRMYSEYLDPKNNADTRRWNERCVDLSDSAGDSVDITLRTTGGPNGDTSYDWAWWADIQFQQSAQ